MEEKRLTIRNSAVLACLRMTGRIASGKKDLFQRVLAKGTRDPFAVEPLPKAFYHPSPDKHLNRAQKSTSIKTNYGTDVREADSEKEKRVSPVDERFLRGTNIYQTKPLEDGDEEGDLDETWPSSERPSSISLTGFLEDENEIEFDRHQSVSNKSADHQVSSLERLRMHGSSAQRAGITAPMDSGKSNKSRIPVKDARSGSKCTKMSGKSKPGERTSGTETNGSVLQRYVDRFRNSEPMSREEREKSKSAAQEFWWLSNGVPSNAGVGLTGREEGKDRESSSHTTPLTVGNLDKYKNLQKLANKQKYTAYIPDSPGDKRTIELQERAEKLLERSSSTVLSTEPAVSTEGLGSNMSDMSSLDEYSYKPKFANYLESEPRFRYQQLVPPPLPGQRAPTEDDPLHQWRLRRRMELAQQSAPMHAPQFDFLDKTEQQKKIDYKLEEFKQRLSGRAPGRSQLQFTPAPVQPPVKTPQYVCVQQESDIRHEPQIASPSLHRPKPRSEHVGEMDPHLHLMCDLLPCPHRGQFQDTAGQGTSRKGSHSQNMVETKDNSCTKCRENHEETGKYKQYLEAEKPDVEKSNSDIVIREADKEIATDTKSEKKSIEEIEKMVKEIGSKDHDIYSRKRSLEDDKHSNKSDRRQSGSKEQNSEHSGSESERSQSKHNYLHKESRHLERESRLTATNKEVKETAEKSDKVLKPTHSSSPKNGRKGVSAAIGQAVKEHLFSTSTSTVLSSVDSLPPSASTERLPWKHKPPSPEQSHDKLVRQIEDNDGCNESDEDFSEDNLLQMLRRQRAIYEQQLQEIDSMLQKMETR